MVLHPGAKFVGILLWRAHEKKEKTESILICCQHGLSFQSIGSVGAPAVLPCKLSGSGSMDLNTDGEIYTRYLLVYLTNIYRQKKCMMFSSVTPALDLQFFVSLLGGWERGGVNKLSVKHVPRRESTFALSERKDL